jgi:hypothetical protein
MTFKQWLKHREQDPQPSKTPHPNVRQTGLDPQLKLETYQKRKRPAG